MDPCTPLDALLYRCVLRPVQEQVHLVDKAGAALFLYGPVRLLAHLDEVRRVVLLEGASPGLVGGTVTEDRHRAVHSLLHPPWPLSEVVTSDVAKG